MEITCIGMGFDATLMLPVLEKNLPARCLGIASKSWDLEGYTGDQIRFSMRPSVDAAALRILPKIKKRTKGADIVFLFSEITGKSQEDIICNIAEGLEDQLVVCVVWYPKRKHGQRGIANTLQRLGRCSAVVSIPQTSIEKVLEVALCAVEQIQFLYPLAYANGEADKGKSVLSHGGLLHLVQEELEIEYLDYKCEGLPWSISAIGYNADMDTVMGYGCPALLHLAVPKGTDPKIVQYICEYIYSHLGEEGELNFSIAVRSDGKPSVGLDLLVADSCTREESSPWDWPPDCSIKSGGNGMTR